MKKSRDSVSVQASLFLVVQPILAALAAALARFPAFEDYFRADFSLVVFILCLALTSALFVLLRLTPLYASYYSRHAVIGLAMIQNILLVFTWGHVVSILFLLPPVLSIYYQSRSFVRRVSVLSGILAVVTPLAAFLCGFETFLQPAGEEVSITVIQLVVEGILLAMICGALLVAAVYSIRVANYQTNLANMFLKSERLGVLNDAQFHISLKHTLSMNANTDYDLISTNVVNLHLYNDLFGYDDGDALLKRIAAKLTEYIGPEGIIGRLVNDSLVCLIPRERFDAETFKEAFFHNTEFADNRSYTVDVVGGVYEITDRRMASDIMCDRAQMAVRSKQAKTDGVAFFRESMIYDARKSQEVLNELQIALKDNQFVPFLQPQCDKDGNLVCAEVLARWKHPDRGLISPNEFIPICEEYGYISDLDRDIWDRACETLSRWDAQELPISHVSVNVSPIDLYQMNVYEEISGLCEKYNLTHDRIHLEITETSMMKDRERVLEIINKLRAAGFAVEIDDFGSGYSSLSMLGQFVVDYIKLDISFVRRLGLDPNAEKVLKRISDLAHDIAAKVIVEGVESEEKLKTLSSLGYDCFQGYYFSKPISVEDFEEKYLKPIKKKNGKLPKENKKGE